LVLLITPDQQQGEANHNCGFAVIPVKFKPIFLLDFLIMEHKNLFGIDDDGKTAGLLSYFFVIGWSMAFFAFHQYERTRLSSFQLRQTLMLYLAYLLARFIVPFMLTRFGFNTAAFSSLYFTMPVNLLFVAIWVKGLMGAMQGEEVPIPIFGQPAQRIFAKLF